MKYLCPICYKGVGSNSIYCDGCKNWVHRKCTNLSVKEFEDLGKNEMSWFCKKCISEIFPFATMEDDDFAFLQH